MAESQAEPLDTAAAGSRRFGVVELRDRLAEGALDVQTLASTCIARIEAADEAIQAWAWFDRDYVLAQARALDERRRSGRAIGPLHGLPVGIKDIIDTRGVPTENGTPADAARVPTRDAYLIQRLKAAGALLMGKTMTAELAYLHPARTRNPHDTQRTPGGSSSGSAAAVAADMVPLAVGTQTGGSMIRPAAYCGVVGYKPSFGAIPRSGVLSQSPSLDTVGVFARTVDAAALLAETLFGYDEADPATSPLPVPRLLDTCRSQPPVAPQFAFVRGPYWEQADADNRAALEELAAFLGEQCFEVELPPAFAEAQTIRECINFAEMAKQFHHYEVRCADLLSAELMRALEAGRATLARDYLAALDWPGVLNAGLDELFKRCDALLTVAAPGVAPASLDSTGSSIFNGTWTLCGTPAISLPLLEAGGLPLGVQLVGARGQDARLLRTAHWLVEHMAAHTVEDTRP